tara:strand:- start:7 stop:471 length:465 start_codon:yes stop_codon:yes gene_type:complete
MADKESAASRIRKKKERIKSGELKWNRMGLKPGTKKPRRAIKEAQKLDKFHSDEWSQGKPRATRKHITKHGSDFDVGDIDAEIKKLEKKAAPKSSRRLRGERFTPSGSSVPSKKRLKELRGEKPSQRRSATGGGGFGGGRWTKDKMGRRHLKIM